MRVHDGQLPGVLRVTPGDKALVKALDWTELLAQRRPDTLLVVLDLGGVEFVSSLFLQGCVELARELARSGQQVALLNMAPHQERLLEFLDGASRLARLRAEPDIGEHLRSLAGAGSPDEGVTRAEKLMLWD